MASSRAIFVASVVICCFIASCHAEILLSSLKKSIDVSASHREGVLMAGEDQIILNWSFNKTFPAGADSSYKKVKVQLCYAPISQKDRAWRKTEDHLKKDKTCQFNIVTMPYKSSGNSFNWTIERDVPTATYFIRVYALDSDGHQTGFGQTTDEKKKDNLFNIQAISGRHTTLDVCSIVFSVFSVVALFGFFYMEKRKAKSSQQK